MIVDTNAKTPSCELMHERAREAGSELRRTLITLASGSIGLMLVVFVSTDKLDYTWTQLLVVGGAVLCHTITAMFGLLAWRCDAQRNYYWALELDPYYADNVKNNVSTRKKNQFRMDKSDKITRYMFVVGVVLIASFDLMRLLHLLN